MKQVFKVVREPTIRNPNGENYTLGRMYIDTACGLYATTLYKLRRFP